MGGSAAAALVQIFYLAIGAIVIVQAIMTIRLLNQKRPWAALRVWMIYPILFTLFFGYRAYLGSRIERATQEDYSGRELPVSVSEVRKILYMNPEKYWGDFDMNGTCGRGCLTILREGILDSIAIQDGINLRVYQLARDDACKGPVANGRVESDASGKLASRGYFDECVTATFVDNYDWDIRINFGGRAMNRPYGPCCAIAEIHERAEDEPRFIARWEGTYHTASSFTVGTIIRELTGRNFEPHPRRRPAKSVDEELALLVDLQVRQPNFPPWRYTSEWIAHVFLEQAKKDGVQRIALSDQDISRLLQIAPARGRQSFESHFRGYDRLLDDQSLARLKEAEAKR